MSNKFQSIRTVNGHDVTVSRSLEGRICLDYSKGLRERTTIIVRELVKGPKSGRALLASLREIHPSYQNSDLKAPLGHLTRAGLLYLEGKGAGTVYSLGQNAKKRWTDYKSK
jgi:hypothetical protein